MPHIRNPLIVQADRTLLLEVRHPMYSEVRDALTPFAELVKSPDYIHTYRLTSLSLWNAAALGLRAETVLSVLNKYAKFPVPPSIREEITRTMGRFGQLQLFVRGGELVLAAAEPRIMEEIMSYVSIATLVGRQVNECEVIVPIAQRGMIKQTLLKLGFPVQDMAGYTDGERVTMALCEKRGFQLRDYQRAAVDAFYAGGSASGGNGVVVLPCGAGKTLVGIDTMVRFGMATLVLTSSTTSVRQWKNEILARTTLAEEQVGTYTSQEKQVRPVTISTYQMITHREPGSDDFPHLSLFHKRDWGLIIYDEVHLLPAPVFRMTADIQAKRRLGLTATLVREDGRADDVFSLIGPKKYELPWRQLEERGFIASAVCMEIRVPLSASLRAKYTDSGERQKFRIAAENPSKVPVVKEVLKQHQGEQILVIGHYVSQLEMVAREIQAPLITGKTPQEEREKLYRRFRCGDIPTLVVSRVANFAVDLPDASVAVQISGTFGSRQEEAQRLGRILRPKKDGRIAHFYSLVSANSKEEYYAHRRQMFLIEQGYQYNLRILESLPS
ncbi:MULTISPECIES: DNA repair helicase XPB [Aneurinibacillus]|uniref:DNA repair helicase XPB n=1 Tax=Aneurinibacillus TaxID=55079 RepID=UPI000708C57F|nr:MULTISPECIES: DNA repair helicase XPB [Aneurinibacillus]AMA73611.1 helicase [Aneurinibacillus sp. XH2]MED0675006.1 helicase-associated domain-containing protein [Aneurinibacillus thermoaerophilus]MED0737409.1 helicase-associated domain-containing protein [Aneurinibacillus thermoaerophilus]MED0756258.1 helicase-associated domain-containing protein [Aneurinibacillus thermoaerophilus]MED0760307.1 helicase-associated domain-containing protein [Aneurinibacillus thermoaerophilus]